MNILKFKVKFNNRSYSRYIELNDAEYNALKGHKKVSICKSTLDLVLDDDYFDENSLVSDECRYNIKIQKNKCDKPKLLNDFKPIDGNRNIVLLLESPHRSEYRAIKIYDRLVPIGPAQGGNSKEAGGAIRENIDSAITHIIVNNNLSLNGDYNLIIINPIQFQASLGSIYEKGLKRTLRNKVWKNIWKIKCNNKFIVQENFIYRLKYYDPDLIINACTRDLKNDIKTLLETSHIESYPINHPANNWYHKKF